jgi:hypothetical protein
MIKGVNRLRWKVLVAAVVAAFVAACSTAETGTPVASRAPAPLKVTGFATDVPQAAEFVQQTRTGPTDFIPVGVTPPARALPTRKPDDVATMQSSLESTRSQHDAIGGRDPNAGSTLANQAKPKKPAPDS